MNQPILATLALTGFTVAFCHAAIPTHWLPFVLTGRVQRWSAVKTVVVATVAGGGHCVITALLGVAITWLGLRIDQSIGHWFGRVAGGAVLLFAGYYLVRQLTGRGHVHFDYPHEHLYQNETVSTQQLRTSDRAAIASLLAFLTLSPCEAFLPIYVSGIRYGWRGFAALTAILSIATVVGMALFTFLTVAGLNRLRLGWLEAYESGIMATILAAVGILILLFER